MRRRDAGFTLIETLIATTLIGGPSTVATPAYSSHVLLPGRP